MPSAMAMAEKIQLPQSGGGLLRYSEDYKSNFEIGPMTVMAAIAVITIVALALRFLL